MDKDVNGRTRFLTTVAKRAERYTNACLAEASEQRKLVRVTVKLTAGEIEDLTIVVKRLGNSCRGGFQNLLLHIWYRLDETSGELVLTPLLLERIHRYAFRYNNALWRRTLRKIFRRTLGANLDRGLRLE